MICSLSHVRRRKLKMQLYHGHQNSAPEMEKIVPKLQKTMKNIEILHACTLLGYHDFESPLALFFSLPTLPALVQ